MPLKTISLALIANSDPDPAAAIRYALDLAGRTRAHLLARIGAPPLVMPPYPIASPMGAAIERENLARRAQTEQTAFMIRTETERLGVIGSVEALSGPYDPRARHLMGMARVSDVCIVLAPPFTEPQQRDILVDILFGSGVPLLLVPANWNKPGPIKRTIVAWDGGAFAARAVRDALPMLEDAESVEVVSVLGEKEIGAEASGADLARHLSRHCREVSVNVLPVGEQGVAATLFAHGILTRADLMVMGGYGHSRLREFVLGGVTRDTLARTDIPTLLSH
jgi:nucleotide-binding universal stress UspA family protein